MIASGGDTGEVIVWRPGASTNQHGDATTWRTSAVLRGHSDDVQDLAWAPGGAAVVTGSVDNECIVWDVPKAKGVLRLQGHTHYVQGVTWDPHGEYLTSQSGDRTVRLFASRGMGAQHQFLSARWCRHVSCQKILKSAEENPDPNAPAPAAPGDKPPRQPLFHDDTMPSFFRRPAWSPCGSFLALPAGVYRDHANAHEQHATYLYQRDRFARPALRLPGISPAVCVRFSPVFYELRGAARPGTPPKSEAAEAPAEVAKPPPVEETATAADEGAEVVVTNGAPAAADDAKLDVEPRPTIDLPYRVLFAVCTTDTVTVYDTSEEKPVAFVGGLHYAAITDAAWSPDGAALVVSSSDGYCSVIKFEEGELGRVLAAEEAPQRVREFLPQERVRAAEEAAEAAAKAAEERAAARRRRRRPRRRRRATPRPSPRASPSPRPAPSATVPNGSRPSRSIPQPRRHPSASRPCRCTRVARRESPRRRSGELRRRRWRLAPARQMRWRRSRQRRRNGSPRSSRTPPRRRWRSESPRRRCERASAARASPVDAREHEWWTFDSRFVLEDFFVARSGRRIAGPRPMTVSRHKSAIVFHTLSLTLSDPKVHRRVLRDDLTRRTSRGALIFLYN